MRKRPGRRLPAICLFSAVLLLAAVCFSVWRSYHSLTVTTYRFPTDKAEGPVRLAVMSDLHEHVFGQDNAPLVEAVAEQKLLSMLPPDLRGAYDEVLTIPDPEVRALVKAADKLSAYLKCVEELKAGNNEFKKAKEQTLAALEENTLPALQYFMEEFLPGFELTLDELQDSVNR